MHGLHQTRHVPFLLAQRLQKAGFSAYCHNYRSLSEPIIKHAHTLHEYLLTHHNPDEPLYMVAHSLGGLVVRQFISDYPMWRIARCVSLGTPHQGSSCATLLRHSLPFIVGRSYVGALDGTTPMPPDDIEFGTIAGIKPIGLGLPFLWYHAKRLPQNSDMRHDGTVFVYETLLPNATDHLLLPVSHTGLLYDKTTAHQAIHFLQTGYFNHS